MFLKLVRIVLRCCVGRDKKNTSGITPGQSVTRHKIPNSRPMHVKNKQAVKTRRKKSNNAFGLNFILNAFRYMNRRTREVNRIGGATTAGPKHFLYHVKECLSKPSMLVVLSLVSLVYFVSPKAVILLPTLVVVGALALVVQSFLPVYIGLDFSLMGAVLGTILFGPIVGVLVVLFTYILAVQLPTGQQDALEYERIFLFSLLALIIPYIPTTNIMLKAVIATYIGEFFEMIWHRYGENYPWIMAFLKVFPRSLIYIYIFHNILGYLV